MTSQREGYCIFCGEYSQGLYIETPGLCNACAAKHGNPKSLRELERNMTPLDPEYSKVADNHFWELT